MEFRRAFDPVRALSSAWTLMLRGPVTLILGGILLFITEEGPSYSWSIDEDWDHPEQLLAGALGLVCCCIGFAVWVVSCLLHIGFAGAVQRVMVTGEEEFSDLFKERGLWLGMVVARLLKYMIIGASFLPFVVMIGGPLLLGNAMDVEELGVVAAVFFGLAYVPIWIYVILGLVLVEQAVAVESLNPVAGLQRSWEVARGNRLSLFFFVLVTSIVALAGLLACCIGVFFTSAWSYTAWYEAYIRFALPTPEEGMWIDAPDPAAVAPGTGPGPAPGPDPGEVPGEVPGDDGV